MSLNVANLSETGFGHPVFCRVRMIISEYISVFNRNVTIFAMECILQKISPAPKPTIKMIKKIISFFNRHRIIKHLLLVLVCACILLFVTIWGLNVYTRHGKAIAVPAVESLTLDDARRILEEKTFKYEISDSIYTRHLSQKGKVYKQVPKGGAHVKRGRTVYLTVYASGVEQKMLPEINSDMSTRQAIALLVGVGFSRSRIRTVSVHGIKDRVVRVLYEGNEVVPGELLPIDAKLTLQVGNGSVIYEEMPEEPTPPVDEEWLN